MAVIDRNPSWPYNSYSADIIRSHTMLIQILRRVVRALSKLGIIRCLNFTVGIKVNSRTLRLPILGGFGVENLQLSEPWLTRCLEVLVNEKEGAFLDVGVNIGQTLIKYLSLGCAQPYYGFEPNTQAAYYADSLIRANQCRRAYVIPVGLSDSTSIGELFMNSELDAAASTTPGFRPAEYYSTRKHIAIFRGDEVIERIPVGPVAILKIDVEGGELEVLKGLRETIVKHRPFIICEVLPIYEEVSEQGIMRRMRTDAIQQILSDVAYTICRQLHNGRIDKLEQIETHKDLDLCEYIFLPNEDACRVINALSQTGCP